LKNFRNGLCKYLVSMKYSYIATFNINFYSRPYLFKKCCGVSIYYLRTFIGFVKNPQKEPKSGDKRQARVARQGAPRPPDPLRFLYRCPRLDQTVILDASLFESLYAPYLLKTEGDGVIITNPYGVFAAKAAGKKVVVVDLMDLWSCRYDSLQLNTFDFHALKKADLVLAWSKAIATYLTSVGVRHTAYLPFGIDLDTFEPLAIPPDIFLEKYSIDPAVFLIVYSGGMWRVMGKDALGVYKLLFAFKHVERRRRDVLLVLQTSKEVMEVAKRIGLRNVLHVDRTKFNDPLRLSLLHSADVLILTASKYPAVYLAERSTMFQYMSSGNAILAEDTPGVRGVLQHIDTAYLVPLDNPRAMADGILQLLNDDGLRKYIGRRARKLLEQYYTWRVLGERAKRLLP